VKGRPGRASGEVIYVQGRVLDTDCRPVAGALVEIWQANRWGRYDHEKDAGNPRPLDPNFQSWAEMLTDAEGRYRFKTIKPGSYPAEGDWIRPPHIHFKIARRGYHELVTQMYFARPEHPDQIRALAPEERALVTVAPQPVLAGAEAGRAMRADITLAGRVGEMRRRGSHDAPGTAADPRWRCMRDLRRRSGQASWIALAEARHLCALELGPGRVRWRWRAVGRVTCRMAPGTGAVARVDITHGIEAAGRAWNRACRPAIQVADAGTGCLSDESFERSSAMIPSITSRAARCRDWHRVLRSAAACSSPIQSWLPDS
jgi:protocatechuate 3,4-dioxygenase beta subunit